MKILTLETDVPYLDTAVPGYHREKSVKPNSIINQRTYVVLKVIVDNWRWAGVPFFLRSAQCAGAAHST